MKVCPQCSFSNPERFPTCVVCNALLVDVPVTLSPDPGHPEHEERALHEKRRLITQRQIRSAGIIYALTLTLTAVFPGLVLSPQALLLYFASAGLVVFAVLRRVAGQFTGSALQGAFSVALLYLFGPVHTLSAMMLIVHIVLPGLFWHWTEMIYDNCR
jgi:hypothetical protein